MIKTERQAMIFLALDTAQDFVTDRSDRRIESGPSREKRVNTCAGQPPRRLPMPPASWHPPLLAPLALALCDPQNPEGLTTSKARS